MKVYTRRGDDGSTGLSGGGRVPKDHPRPEAYGQVDELQAAIGLARAAATDDLAGGLVGLEADLWVVMTELATDPQGLDRLEAGAGRPTTAMVDRLEGLIDEASGRFDPPTEFVLPGEDEVAARLDVARTVCRRAERAAVAVVEVDSAVVPYLNRLSDLLWTLARWQEGTSRTARSVAGATETPPDP